MLGNWGAHALYPGGENVALWYRLKQCDGRPSGEHGGVLLLRRERRGGVLGGWSRRWNLSRRTRSDLQLRLCCRRVWWYQQRHLWWHRVSGNSRVARMRRFL